MRGEKADMVFMDPPYNVNFDGRGSVGESWLKNARGRRSKKLARSILNDHMTDEEFLVFCAKLFSNMRRSVKDSAPVYACCSDKAMLQFRQAFSQAGRHWSCTLIWAKHLFTLSRADYHPQHEPILYGWPEGHAHSWRGRRDQGTVDGSDSRIIPQDGRAAQSGAPPTLSSYIILRLTPGTMAN